MSQEGLADCEEKGLPWKEFGGVGRLLQDMERFEVLPQRMRGIGEAARREGISLEKIAVFIVYGRYAARDKRQQRNSQGYGQQEHEQDGHCF